MHRMVRKGAALLFTQCGAPLVRRLKDIAEYKGHYEDPVLRTLCIT